MNNDYKIKRAQPELVKLAKCQYCNEYGVVPMKSFDYCLKCGEKQETPVDLPE